MPELTGRSVLVFVGDDYEDLEVWYPVLRLREAGAKVVIAGLKAGVTHKGKYGYPCPVEISVEGLSAKDFAAVVCPGGWMPDKVRRDENVKRLVREFNEQKKVIAAVCHGGWIPISAGVYKGVKVTGSPGIKDDLVNAGAIWEDASVVVDRHFVSSRKPDDLPDFCKGILAARAMIGLQRRHLGFLGAGAIGIAFGVYVNPFLTTWWDQHQTILGIVTSLVLAAVSLEVVRSLRLTSRRLETSSPPTGFPAVFGFWLVMFSWAMLYRYPWSGHQLSADDYRYLSEAGRDWNGALQNLFKPFNEHLVVTTRMVTAQFVHNGDFVSSRLAMEDWCGRIAGLLFLMTTALFFEFLRRTWGERAALVGLALFAVSVCHSEVVLWYSAAQWLIPVSILLGSLLIVERPGGKRLFAATLLSGFAPWNYSIGAIVGPFTTFWLIAWHRRWQWRSLLPAVFGVLSTLVVLMIVRGSMAEEQYWSSGGRGMFEAFSPWMGLIYSARLFVDRLLLVNLGYRGLPVSLLTSATIVGVMGIAVVAAIRRRPSLAVLWPAAALIVVGYGIAVPFRTWEPYASLASWNRYQLIPHLGLSMLVAGAVSDAVQTPNAVIDWRKLVWFTVGLSLWGLWQGRTLFYS